MIHFGWSRTHRPDWTSWHSTPRTRVCPDGATVVSVEARACRRCARTQQRPGTVVVGPVTRAGSLDDGKWRR